MRHSWATGSPTIPTPHPRLHPRASDDGDGASKVRCALCSTGFDRLWSYEHAALVFLEDFAVPFDNNQAERDLRMITVHQKVSGTFCSDAGPDAFCRIRPVCSTWRQQGRSVLDALEAAFAGRSLSLQIPS